MVTRFIDLMVLRSQVGHLSVMMARIGRVIRFLEERDVGTIPGADAEVSLCPWVCGAL